MKEMRCTLLSLNQHYDSSIFTARIKRLDDHPKLGMPRECDTYTSAIRFIDFDRGIIVTQNSIYTFKPRGRFDD